MRADKRRHECWHIPQLSYIEVPEVRQRDMAVDIDFDRTIDILGELLVPKQWRQPISCNLHNYWFLGFFPNNCIVENVVPAFHSDMREGISFILSHTANIVKDCLFFPRKMAEI